MFVNLVIWEISYFGGRNRVHLVILQNLCFKPTVVEIGKEKGLRFEKLRNYLAIGLDVPVSFALSRRRVHAVCALFPCRKECALRSRVLDPRLVF